MTDSPIDLSTLMPFAQTLGVELVAASPDEVRSRLDWHERLCTAGGVLHVGAAGLSLVWRRAHGAC